MSLIITDLHAGTKDGKEILRGLTLTINQGEKHAIMGPNGGGKSTLAHVLMGHPGYVVTSGTIMLNGVNITTLPPNERAKLGLFLGFQYPVEVAGVNFANFLRLSLNAVRPTDKKVSPIAFRKILKEHVAGLGFSTELAKRSLK